MYRIKQITILLGDLLLLFIGLYFGVFLRYMSTPTAVQFSDLVSPFTKLFLLAITLIFITGLYDLGRAKNNWEFFKKIITTALIWTILGVLYFYIFGGNQINPKTILALTALFGFGLIAIWRYFYNRFISVNILKTRVAFIGYSPEVKQLIEIITSRPQIGYEVAGIINTFPNDTGTKTVALLKDLEGKPDLIVLGFNYEKDEALTRELYKNIFKQTSIIELADFYETIFRRLPPFTFSEIWFITKLQEQSKKIYDRFRMLTDYVAAIIIAIFFIITFPFVALAIKLNSRGPVFFRQARVGRNGTIFYIYKYRTMKALNTDGSAETNGPQYASEKDNRITGVGKFLRATRLDEIPQFINIFRNEMGLIGPRPERPEFVEKLTELMPFYPLRHLIKPGCTGWAQLQRGYYGTLDENLGKLEYDLFYIKNRGPALDIAIILKTFSIIISMIGR
ncbi:MAG: exopolysaccharide biosynthesis polyprenyl glycosylphosphotransferase [Candidatus Magasanikbacteria bacterium]|nr:exopolysaccharide biosynthesis polyprenyl glycosylphosphotransferase [Candidatus Magasanikbacteria bacterium]